MIRSTHGEFCDDGDAASLANRARRILPGGLIGRAGLPPEVGFIPVRGNGARIFDRDGRSYIDYLAGAGALILGHSHPAVVAAIESQARDGLVFFGLPSEPVITLAEELVAVAPRAERAIMTTTGSEATMYAMRLARAYTKKNVILKFEGTYHGNHDFVQVSTSSLSSMNEARGALDSLGVPNAIEELILIAPFNDVAAVRQIVKEHRVELAAIIVDPMPRGGIFPLSGFILELRQIADEFGVLLIFDEVMTGFRLAYGGAQEYFDVEADLTCYGKIIGGGLPLGAVVGPADILQLVDTTQNASSMSVLVNGTMHGAPIAAAAGLAALTELRRPGVYDLLNKRTDLLRREIDLLFRHFNLPAIVDGQASYWHLAFSDRPHKNLADSLAADHDKIVEFDSELIRRGIYLLPGGRRLVTTAHTDEDINDTLHAIASACESFR